VSGSAESSGAKEAGLYLAELLKGAPYRLRWSRPGWITRGRQSELHHAAVAHVLEEYLHAHPREDRRNDHSIGYTQLASLVSNALTGKRLSSETLGVFIDAFRVSREHADRLSRIHSGLETIHLVSNASTVPLDTVTALSSRNYTTRYVHDHHYVGSDGFPHRHETLLIVQANANGVDRYVYAVDTDHLTVEALTGEILGAPYVEPSGRDVIDIIFNHPLAAGDTYILKYETTFQCKSLPSPAFKRLVTVRTEYAEVKVTFHPSRLPKEIREADWKSIESDPDIDAVATLDDYHSVTRFLKGVENSGYGFTWEWR
jgi:hypothetical protein